MLSSQFASEVPRKVRFRGSDLLAARRVKIQASDSNIVVAEVRGSQIYTVELHVDRSERAPVLVMSCSCPYFDDRLDVCKHIWAVLLRADELKALRDAAGQIPLSIEVDPEFIAGRDPDSFPDDDDEFRHSPASTFFQRIKPLLTGKKQPTKKPPAKKPLPPPPWSAPLKLFDNRPNYSAPPANAPVVPSRRLLFAISPPANASRRDLVVEVLLQERKQDGDWSKPKSRALSGRDIDTFVDEVDRQLLGTLLGVVTEYSYGGYMSPYAPSENMATNFTIPARLYATHLPAICDRERCLVRIDPKSFQPKPIVWDAEPWTFETAWEQSADGKTFSLIGRLRRGDVTRPLGGSDIVHLPHLVLIDDRLSLLHTEGLDKWLEVFRKTAAIPVPLAMKDQFLRDIAKMPLLPARSFPEEFGIASIDQPPRPKLLIRQQKGSYQNRLEADLQFVYGDKTVNGREAAENVFSPETGVLIRRHTHDENAARRRMVEVGFTWQNGYSRQNWELVASKLPKVVNALTAEGWIVEAEGKLYRKVGEIKIEIATNIDWFDLNAKVDFDGQTVSLPKLLQALKKGDGIVALDDGSFGMLPDEWLKKYGVFASVGQVEGDSIRFGKTQVGLLDALLAAQPEATFDVGFTRAREQLRSFERIEPAAPSPTFQGELRGYQRDGLGWLQFLQTMGWGGCLADDMGLGKTVQVLAMLEQRAMNRPKDSPRPSLVVVPRSLVFNWKSEAAKFAPNLKVLEHHRPDRVKDPAVFAEHDIVLTTYGIARNDAPFFADCRFDYCILDESQAIKNASTEQAKAARLLKADHRLAMSGTPIENHLGELWSLFEFLNPGMLGHSSVFKLSGAGARNPEPETRALLSKALRPFLLRRTKDQVAKDLPEKTEQTLFCDLDPEQRKLYDELRDYYRTALLGKIAEVGMKKATIMVLEALMRLRQAACHPGLIDKKKTDVSSAKLDVLMPQLLEVFEEGHKAIVFSQFTSFLSIIKKKLDADNIPYEYLDGKTRDRQACVDRFQNDPECKLFLISLKAGGVGLNLTAAEYVFLLDPWWNPAVEAQAIDRTHRIGQTRPVFAYRLIARGTVEEKVLELQKSKRDLADAIIGAENSMISSLKKEDLEMLLG